ncbi:MAG: histidine utilization repressor [Gordonia sp. (in: high G+C Gram-positive bacteria)]|uniref:histidine utilization repressor n=1 Tax=Gordonia sp. (in: high G+C Gram-positive bacteria) TaxID=84139 RepID=UPI003C72ECCB
MAAIELDVDLSERYARSAQQSLPAYERVKKLVVDQISAGEWTEGAQLPSENQFVAALGLSRMTINRALRELTADGVLTRLVGVGTFVAGAKSASPLFEVRNIADEIQARGRRHRTDVVSVTREESTGGDGILWDAAGATVFHSVLVHYEDDRPIQVEDRLVDPEQAPEYLSQDFTEITPNDYLTRVAPLVRGEHVVEAVLATPDESRLLQIDRGEPCLLIRRRTWSARGLVSVARLVHPGSRSRLVGEFGG